MRCVSSGLRGAFQSVFETLKDGAGIVRRLLQGIVDAVSHFKGGLEGSLFTSILAVREVFGELIPFAADTQTPALEGCRFVCISGNVALCHGLRVWLLGGR